MLADPVRLLGLVAACLLLFVADVVRAQPAPDEALRGMTPAQREGFWNSMSPQQRRDFWRQLTPEQRLSIRNHILAQQPPVRDRPMAGPVEGPSRWRFAQPPVPGGAGPRDPLAGPALPPPEGGPRHWSMEERRRFREQIQEWNREPPGPTMPPHRMGRDR